MYIILRYSDLYDEDFPSNLINVKCKHMTYKLGKRIITNSSSLWYLNTLLIGFTDMLKST